jgi:hypothetical protein
MAARQRRVALRPRVVPVAQETTCDQIGVYRLGKLTRVDFIPMQRSLDGGINL